MHAAVGAAPYLAGEGCGARQQHVRRREHASVAQAEHFARGCRQPATARDLHPRCRSRLASTPLALPGVVGGGAIGDRMHSTVCARRTCDVQLDHCLQWYHSLHKHCIITLHKLCLIIMQMHNPSHFCIITISLFLALGAQSEIANVLPKRCASRERPLLPDYANN
jgi:hypothetical protein